METRFDPLAVPQKAIEPPTMPHRLADALCSTYGISKGTELVYLLGRGDEPDNQTAMETWVRNALHDLDEKPALDLLSYLVDRLGATLNNKEISK